MWRYAGIDFDGSHWYFPFHNRDGRIIFLTLHDEPLAIIVIYLIAFYAFAGLVGILRAVEAKKQGGAWKVKMLLGVIEVATAGLALFCGLVLRSPDYVVLVYGVSVIISGVMRIVNSLRRTAVVYIPA